MQRLIFVISIIIWILEFKIVWKRDGMKIWFDPIVSWTSVTLFSKEKTHLISVRFSLFVRIL